MDELQILRWVQRRVPGDAVPLARAVTFLGATSVVWTFVGVSALLAGIRSRRCGPLLRPVCALAVASVSRRVLAYIVSRDRPPERFWRVPRSGPSWPSRHTTLATLGAGLTAEAFESHPRAWLVMLPVGCAVGFSRVVLGVHWPSDVMAGWAFAAAGLAVARDFGR